MSQKGLGIEMKKVQKGLRIVLKIQPKNDTPKFLGLEMS